MTKKHTTLIISIEMLATQIKLGWHDDEDEFRNVCRLLHHHNTHVFVVIIITIMLIINVLI